MVDPFLLLFLAPEATDSVDPPLIEADDDPTLSLKFMRLLAIDPIIWNSVRSKFDN